MGFHEVLFVALSLLITFPFAYSQNKFWVDPSCDKPIVAAINEARYLSIQMADALSQLAIDPDLEWPLLQFFRVSFADKHNMEYIIETYRRIGNLERVMNRRDSQIRIYCDNMESFVTQASNSIMSPTDPAFDTTLFVHPEEESLGLGEHMACRQNERLDSSSGGTFAMTFTDPTTNWNNLLDLPETQPQNRAVIYMCNSILDIAHDTGRYTTLDLSKQLATANLNYAVAEHVLSSIFLHEFVHVPALSQHTYVDPDTGISTNLENGHDAHGPNQLDGYWDVQWDHGKLTSGSLPGWELVHAEYTTNNPDSYAGLALALGMGNKQWKFALSDAGPFILKWVPRPIDNYVEPAFGSEWPNEPPNWTNEPTPPSPPALPAARRDSVLSNDTMGMESSTVRVADGRVLGPGLIALSS